MDVETIKLFAEHGSSMFLLCVFVYFFLTKFSQSQERIVGQIGEMTNQIVRMNEKQDASNQTQLKIVEHLTTMEKRIENLERYQIK